MILIMMHHKMEIPAIIKVKTLVYLSLLESQNSNLNLIDILHKIVERPQLPLQDH